MMIRDLDLDDVPDRVRSLLDDAAAARADGRGDAPRRQAERGRGDRRGADRACRPLDGRRLWFVGIGGAGLSAYAQLARALGCRGRRLGPRRDALPRAARGASRSRSRPSRSCRPAGRRSSRRRTRASPGTSRAELLAELVALRRSIVVAGTHGKGTTAAMIAFALRETGGDPAWLIGAPVPQLGSNAGAGEGWLVVEGDESDRTVFGLPAEIAVVTNVELDHHSEFRSLAELEAEFDRWARAARACGARRSALRGAARAAGRAQPRERRARRSPRSSWPASTARRRRPRARPVRRDRPPLRGLGGRRGDDRRRLRAPSRRDRGDDRGGPRGLPGPARCGRSSSRISSRGRGTSPPSSVRRSLPPTTSSSPTSTSPARSADPAVTRQARRRRALRPRAARRPGSPSVGRRRPRTSRAGREPGDVLLVLGAGDVDAAPALIRERAGGAAVIALEEGVPLSRLTTIGTGGPARLLRAGPATLDELEEVLAWAAGRGRARSRRSGSARTCSPHDDGRRRARAAARGRARGGAGRGRDPRRGRRRDERRLPPPRARRRASAGSSSPRRSPARPAAACG